MTNKIILIFGLSGSGKTTLADEVAKNLDASRLNADDVRVWVNTDLDFSEESRTEQAYRMGMLANRMALTNNVVVDFICPTDNTRLAFQNGSDTLWDDCITVWMNTVQSSKYPDTDMLFEIPDKCTVTVDTKDKAKWSEVITDYA